MVPCVKRRSVLAVSVFLLGSSPVFAQRPQLTYLSEARRPSAGSDRDEAQTVLRTLIETYKTTFPDESWPPVAPLEQALSYDPGSDARLPRFRISFSDEAKTLWLTTISLDRDRNPIGEIVLGKGFYAGSIVSNSHSKPSGSSGDKKFLERWLGKRRETESAREEMNGRLVLMTGFLRRLDELGKPEDLVRYRHCVFESVASDEQEPCASFLWDLVFDASKTMEAAGSLEAVGACRKKKCKRKDLLQLMPESMPDAVDALGEEKGLRYYVFCELKKEFPNRAFYFPYWEKRR